MMRQTFLWIAAATTAICLPFATTHSVTVGASPDDRAVSKCEALTSLSFPETAVKQASVVSAGGFSAPNGRGNATFKALPSFCRVALTLSPS